MDYRLRKTALIWRDINGELIAFDAVSDTSPQLPED
jgi:hypothetical protein